jgi:hypothetical protein
MTAKCPLIVMAAIALAAAAPALAQPSSAPPSGSTASLQHDPAGDAFFGPLLKAYYELSVTELKGRTDKADPADFEKKSYALFRSYAASKGANPDALQNHLKAIPRQVVQIVKEDPKVLDSQQNFDNALLGPP